MIFIHVRFYRPNGDYYTVILAFESSDLTRVAREFETFSSGFFAATGCKVGWDRILTWGSSESSVFKIPSETPELSKYLKSKGFGCVQSNSS